MAFSPNKGPREAISRDNFAQLPLPSLAADQIFSHLFTIDLTTPQHPILAIDYGDARIGLAATDDFAIAAHPVETIHLSRTDPLERLREIITRRKIQTLLLGLPLRLDGTEGDSAKKVRKFGAQLAHTFPDLPLVYHDETFTTSTASAKLRQAGKNTRKQKNIIDQAAALEILQSYLGW